MIFPHIQRFAPGVLEWALKARPRRIKVMDANKDCLKELKNQHHCWTWYRHFFAGQWLDNPIARAKEARAAVLAGIGESRQYVDAVSGFNETGLWEQAALYREFEAEYARLLHADGLQVVSGNFSVEQPPLEHIKSYLPVPGDYLGLNEYQAPDIWTEVNRDRRLLRHLEWRKAGYTGPILIGETGIDRGVMGEALSGWRAPSHEVSIPAYCDQLRWLAKLFYDSGVTGAFLFNCGGADLGWRTFEVGNVPEIAETMAALGDLYPDAVAPAPAPVPPAPVTPTPPTPGGGGRMPTFIDPADLALTQNWQQQRNNNGEDPSDGAAFLALLKGIGKDYTQPRKYGAIVVGGAPVPAPAPGLPLNWTPIDLRGKLPTRPGVAPYTLRPLAGITGRTIHFTASTRRAGEAAVRAIAAYQTGPGAQEDFPAIAYTLIVDGAGAVFWLHNLDVRVWHSGARPGGISRNVSNVGICFISATDPTPDQILGIAKAIVWTDRQLGKVGAIEGHRDPPYPTSCPGPGWPKWRVALEQAITGYR